MATVTGLTAEKMLELADENIIAAEIVGGELILTTRGGTDINVGTVVGPEGDAGPTGPPASFAGYTEPENNLGSVGGAVTIDFNTHNVWRINPTSAVVITFSNLPSAGDTNPGTLIVENSTYAITWPAGTKFPAGDPPVLDGETWLSMVARSTHVTVGLAWAGVTT